MNHEEKELEFDQQKVDAKELENTLTLLDSILQKATSTMIHFDTQTNILIGITIAISALALSHIDNEQNSLVFIVMSFFSMLSTFICLYAVHPPKRMTKRGQKESLFYNKNIIEFGTPAVYAKELNILSHSKDKIIEQYALDIYNIYKYHCGPKRRLFNIGRNVLFFGIFVTAGTYVLQHFFLLFV